MIVQPMADGGGAELHSPGTSSPTEGGQDNRLVNVEEISLEDPYSGMVETRAHEYMTEEELFADFGKGPGHGLKSSPERTYKLHLDNKIKMQHQKDREEAEYSNKTKYPFQPTLITKNKGRYSHSTLNVFERLSANPPKFKGTPAEQKEQLARFRFALADQTERGSYHYYNGPKKMTDEEIAQKVQQLYNIGVDKQKKRAELVVEERSSFTPRISTRRKSEAPFASPVDAEALVKRLYRAKEEEHQKREELQKRKDEKEMSGCTFSPDLVTKGARGSQFNVTYSDNQESVGDRLYQQAKAQRDHHEQLLQQKLENEDMDYTHQPISFTTHHHPMDRRRSTHNLKRTMSRNDITDTVSRLHDEDMERRRVKHERLEVMAMADCTFQPDLASARRFSSKHLNRQELPYEHDDPHCDSPIHSRLWKDGHEKLSRRRSGPENETRTAIEDREAAKAIASGQYDFMPRTGNNSPQKLARRSTTASHIVKSPTTAHVSEAAIDHICHVVSAAIRGQAVPLESLAKKHSVSCSAFGPRELQTIVRQILKLPASEAPLDHVRALFRLVDKPPTGFISIQDLEAFVNGNETGDDVVADVSLVDGEEDAASAAAAEAAADEDIAAGSVNEGSATDEITDSEASWVEKKAAWTARRATLSVSPPRNEALDTSVDDDPLSQPPKPLPGRPTRKRADSSNGLKAASARAIEALEERRKRADEEKRQQEEEEKRKEEKRKAAKAKARRASALAAEKYAAEKLAKEAEEKARLEAQLAREEEIKKKKAEARKKERAERLLREKREEEAAAAAKAAELQAKAAAAKAELAKRAEAKRKKKEMEEKAAEAKARAAEMAEQKRRLKEEADRKEAEAEAGRKRAAEEAAAALEKERAALEAEAAAEAAREKAHAEEEAAKEAARKAREEEEKAAMELEAEKEREAAAKSEAEEARAKAKQEEEAAAAAAAEKAREEEERVRAEALRAVELEKEAEEAERKAKADEEAKAAEAAEAVAAAAAAAEKEREALQAQRDAEQAEAAAAAVAAKAKEEADAALEATTKTSLEVDTTKAAEDDDGEPSSPPSPVDSTPETPSGKKKKKKGRRGGKAHKKKGRGASEDETTLEAEVTAATEVPPSPADDVSAEDVREADKLGVPLEHFQTAKAQRQRAAEEEKQERADAEKAGIPYEQFHAAKLERERNAAEEKQQKEAVAKAEADAREEEANARAEQLAAAKAARERATREEQEAKAAAARAEEEARERAKQERLEAGKKAAAERKAKAEAEAKAAAEAKEAAAKAQKEADEAAAAERKQRAAERKAERLAREAEAEAQKAREEAEAKGLPPPVSAFETAAKAMQDVKAKNDAEKAAAEEAAAQSNGTVAEGEGAAATNASSSPSEATTAEDGVVVVPKMEGAVLRPSSKKEGEWVSRWLSTGGTGKTADILCCYKSKEKKKLLNAMKLYIATDIRCGTEPSEQEEGLFIITVNGKDYPFKAGSAESAQEWVGALTKLQKNTKFREKRGSVVNPVPALDGNGAADAAAAATSELNREEEGGLRRRWKGCRQVHLSATISSLGW